MLTLRFAFIFSLIAFLSGCSIFHPSKNREILIPREDTAKGQFEVAFAKEKDARSYFDKKKRDKEMEVAILAYEKVELWFPNDKVITPVAGLKIAIIQSELEQYQKAAKTYERILNQYPSDTEVRINSLFGLGTSLDQLNRSAEAQVYYKLLIDEFQNTRNTSYKSLVEQARVKYRQIR